MRLNILSGEVEKFVEIDWTWGIFESERVEILRSPGASEGAYPSLSRRVLHSFSKAVRPFVKSPTRILCINGINIFICMEQ